MIFRVVALDAEIAAASQSPEVKWTWPDHGLLTEIWLGLVSGLPADLAQLGIRIYDGKREIVEDGRVGEFASALGLGGLGALGGPGAWFPLARVVEPGNLNAWTLQIDNTLGANPVRPIVQFRFLPRED